MGLRQSEDLAVGNARPRVGISACLLGAAVRFDGGHKRDRFLTETLARFVEWVTVCPEVECGLGTPRESMRLVRQGGEIRLLTVRSGVDLTDRMTRFARDRSEQLSLEDLSGYVLKKDSPSCGLQRVKVYEQSGSPLKTGRGLFATALLQRSPHLPCEEEGRLSDSRIREHFVARVFGFWRVQRFFRTAWTVGSLVDFHAAQKLMLMAHSPEGYQRLGRLVAGATSIGKRELERQYVDLFMNALSIMPSRRRHVNVLQHMAGYFKTSLDSAARAELVGAIEDYRRAIVPLIVPLTLLRHHIREQQVTYLADQRYLEPHPRELMLLNLV